MQNNIILFDIDYTLFDVGKYREKVFTKLQELLPDIPDVQSIASIAYEEIRKDGWFEISSFTKQFLSHVVTTTDAKLFEEVWRDPMLLKESVYPEAIGVLEKLQGEHFILGIFSSGYVDFQKSKIDVLKHFFEEEHIHIHKLKDTEFPVIVEKYQGRKIILVDDYIPVIEKAKRVDAAITTVWIKRGRLSEKVAPSSENPPDFTITNLTDLSAILEKDPSTH